MLLTIWAGVGYYSVIFLAGLQNIPEELYDAARIDGCNDFQKHRYVSLPGLRPQIVFVAVISSLAALKVFDEIYVLTNRTGGILDSGVTMVFYLWKQAFSEQPRGVRVGDRHRAARHHPRLLDLQRPHPRARRGGRGMSQAPMIQIARARGRSPAGAAVVPRPTGGRRAAASGTCVLVAPRRHHGLPVLLDADDVAEGPARPDLLDPAAVHPERPDASPRTSGSSRRCRSRRSS